jgi:hypothetical protein
LEVRERSVIIRQGHAAGRGRVKLSAPPWGTDMSIEARDKN